MSANSVWIALLRGINVGGKNKLPMKALVGMFEELGCEDVRSYIQSGNVIFGATRALARTVPDGITAAIRREFGYEIPVVLRSASEFRSAAARHPFAKGADPSHLGIAFLADRPTATAIARLDPDRSPPDRFEVSGREVHLLLPEGAARTKLTNAYFDTKLRTVSTGRNWRTIQKLIELS